MDTHNRASTNLNGLVLPMPQTLPMGWLNAVILVVGHVTLDWASYFHSLQGLNTTTWSPAPAVGLLFLLRYGRQATPLLALAIIVGDAFVRDLPPWRPDSIALSLLLTLGYWVIAEILRYRLTNRGVFNDQRGLFGWAAIVIAGTLANSVVFTTALAMAQRIPVAGEAVFRHWIGDVVGIVVLMPLFWMLLDDAGRSRLRRIVLTWEALAALAATALALWVAFGFGVATDFKYFFVVFLPIAWGAARHGLAGAALGAALVQVGIIVTVQWLQYPAILEIQALGAVLALLGFFIGVVVDEKERLSVELRQSLRLAAAGEMAGALAHELNQPLTALSAYGTACEEMLARGETGAPLRQAIGRMVAESFRAADVVRHLRDFFRTGTTKLAPLPLAELLATVARPFTAKAAQQGVEFSIARDTEVVLLADRLQLEVVLRNLLANAFEATLEQPAGRRRVEVSVAADGAARVCVQVEDSGAGFTAASAARLFEAFQSSKASGLGLGLVISRAIVEAHGGHLWAEVADHGVFKLVLPTEGKWKHAS